MISATTISMKDVVALVDALEFPKTAASRDASGAIGDEIETKEDRSATAALPPSIVIAASVENARTGTIEKTRVAVGTASSAPNVVATVRSVQAAKGDASETIPNATKRGVATATPDTAGMTTSLTVATVIGGA